MPDREVQGEGPEGTDTAHRDARTGKAGPALVSQGERLT
jgi:hypothetical protein